MVLHELETYCDNSLIYWENQINSSSFNNKADLISEVTIYLDELKLSLNIYRDGLSKQDFVSFIYILYTYITNTELIVTDDPDIPQINTISVDPVEYYHYWNYTLPDVEELFLLEEDPETSGNGIIYTQPLIEDDIIPYYDSLKIAIENEFAITDNEYINAQGKSIANEQMDFNMYRIFAQPQVTVNSDIDIKQRLLDEYNLQQISDEFTWEFPGLYP